MLGGMAVAELVGMTFMLFALTKTFHAFDLKALFRDTTRVAAATLSIVVAGMLALQVSVPAISGERALAATKIGLIGIAIVITVYPAFRFSGLLSSGESRSIMGELVNRGYSGLRYGLSVRWLREPFVEDA